MKERAKKRRADFENFQIFFQTWEKSVFKNVITEARIKLSQIKEAKSPMPAEPRSTLRKVIYISHARSNPIVIEIETNIIMNCFS